jgi:hypothetical protein
MYEAFNAVATGATFLVIAVTAIAALIQLRHIRKGNWLAAQLTILEMWHSDKIQTAYDYIKTELPEKLEDPQYRAELEHGPIVRSKHLEMTMVDWNAQLGLLLEQELIDDAFISMYMPAIRTSWNRLAPVLAILRRSRNTSILHFDYLYARAIQFETRRPDIFGKIERPTIDDPWISVDHPENA